MVKFLSLGKTNASNQDGVILIAVLVISAALVMIGLAMTESAASGTRLAEGGVYGNNALLAAEAGVEQSVEQLNQSDSFSGYGTAQTFFNNSTQGKGTFVTTVAASPDGTNAKIITSTGSVYRPGITAAVQRRTVKVTAVGTSSPGYSVYTGPGGLILSGAASINNSDVYVNGTISMSGAARIGSDLQPSNVYVANDACPTGSSPGSTYPSVCASGQPISMPDYSTTAIIGTVCATGQTQSKFPNSPYNVAPAQIRAGLLGGTGLTPGCTSPPAATPTYDRASQIAAVTTTASGTSNSYVCNSYPFNRTWAANLKLTGNVEVGGSCNVILKGNVYITGNLNLDGAARIAVDDSAGTTRPVVIVDGTITVGGSAALISNLSGTGVEFISFKSAASCSPSCSTVTGNDLKNSQSLQTVSVGGGVSFPGMIFDAYWGKISITGSGNVGSAIGQTVDMSGAGSVIFGTSLSSGVKTWSVTSYQQVANPG